MAKNEEKKKLTEEEYVKRVKALAKGGLTSEKIGQKLRDEGIHPSEHKNKISKILEKDYENPDLKNVEKKLERIQKHFEKNQQDKRSKREKDRVFSQVRKIKKYLKIAVR